MRDIEEILDKGICCIIPIYKTGIGNSTKLIIDDGTVIIDKRMVKTILSIIAKYYTIHIQACRAKYGKMLHQRLCVPIFIHNKLLLIPFKMRKPKFPKDGAHGYINFYSIEEIKETNKYTIVRLKNGIEVTCLHRMRTVLQHINKAKLIEREAYANGRYDEQKFHEFYIQYNSPATKGDIARLQKEILELREILKKMIKKET
ncbi:hypothetical protein FQB35_02350 [Crassaminicella thermophila]|uniref:ComK protein n=1 Tax=Crassaminicella thermophila TaxID=2599308 RepID=A0A5C0SAV0_CRATE|nr:hypothetical protein [Crassaminicella thermophila]QEK11301.1 hypothetical protein FQB35_02350 [Crassaminicella thermophila]